MRPKRRPNRARPLACLLLSTAGSCTISDGSSGPSGVSVERIGGGGTGENVLIVIADDLGVDQVEAYGLYPGQPPTPTISTLAADGVRFERAYAFPTCSPSRAALMTGRLPNRVGIGGWIEPPDDYFDLPLAEVTIPEMLDQGQLHTYTSALFGKWHLATHRYPDYGHHALDQGFDWWQGSPENLGGALHQDPNGGKNNYYHWEKSTNGVLAHTEHYATTDTVDDALAKIPTMPEPWFVVVSFNAPHIPLHLPPAHLHTQNIPLDDCALDSQACWRAMVEALDTELGRLLQGLDPALLDRTTTIFTADNGTSGDWIVPPFRSSRGKGTLFDGGVRVPLIVTGPHVSDPGSVSDAFANLVDLFPTVAELAGVDLTTVRPVPGAPVIHIDGRSLVDVIEDPSLETTPYQFSQKFAPNGPTDQLLQERTMARSSTHKLIRITGDRPELYRYVDGAIDEGDDLLGPAGPPTPEDLSAYRQLDRLLDTIVASASYEGP